MKGKGRGDRCEENKKERAATDVVAETTRLRCDIALVLKVGVWSVFVSLIETMEVAHSKYSYIQLTQLWYSTIYIELIRLYDNIYVNSTFVCVRYKSIFTVSFSICITLNRLIEKLP